MDTNRNLRNRAAVTSSSSQRIKPPAAAAAVRSDYPAYLLLFSISFIVLVPYLVPRIGLLQRSNTRKNGIAAGHGGGVENTVKAQDGAAAMKGKYSYRSVSASTPLPQSTADVLLSSSLEDRYNNAAADGSMESMVMAIQKTLQTEREKILKLENQVKMLDLSERYLKERLEQMAENSKGKEGRFSKAVEAAAAGGGSVDMGALAMDGGAGGIDTREIWRAMEMVKERMSGIDMAVHKLEASEAHLMQRMDLLEHRLSLVMASFSSLGKLPPLNP